jgi:omega-amidase
VTPLRVAVWAFTSVADPTANAAMIRRGIAAAAAARTEVLVTPECALTGYPGAVRPGLDDLNSCALGELEDSLLLAAEQAGIALVLGTAAPDGHGGWTNDAATRAARYRKRCLTPGDTTCFTAGSRAVTFTARGWKLGLAICYDLRFPDIWTDLAHLGVDAYVVPSHMAGPDVDPGTKAAVIPALCAVRSAETATPLVLANTAAADRWLDSGAWDARGIQVAQLAAGLLTVDLAPRSDFAPWYTTVRNTYLARSGRTGLPLPASAPGII